MRGTYQGRACGQGPSSLRDCSLAELVSGGSSQRGDDVPKGTNLFAVCGTSGDSFSAISDIVLSLVMERRRKLRHGGLFILELCRRDAGQTRIHMQAANTRSRARRSTSGGPKHCSHKASRIY
jgi:hypothetical protein